MTGAVGLTEAEPFDPGNRKGGQIEPHRSVSAPLPRLGHDDTEALADLIAHHDAYRVNNDGWTVCICGHVAVDDDDDGSHARHVAAVLADRVREAKVQALRDAADAIGPWGDEFGHPWLDGRTAQHTAQQLCRQLSARADRLAGES